MSNYPLFDSYKKIKNFCKSKEIFYNFLAGRNRECYLVNTPVDPCAEFKNTDKNLNVYVTFICFDDIYTPYERIQPNKEKLINFLDLYAPMKNYFEIESSDGKSVAFIHKLKNYSVRLWFLINSHILVVDITTDDFEQREPTYQRIIDTLTNEYTNSTPDPVLNVVLNTVDDINEEYLILNF